MNLVNHKFQIFYVLSYIVAGFDFCFVFLVHFRQFLSIPFNDSTLLPFALELMLMFMKELFNCD